MQNNFRNRFGLRSAVIGLIMAAACTLAQSHGSSADVAGSNSVVSGSASVVNVSGVGSAMSDASNRGSAYTQVQSSGSAGLTGRGEANVGVPGYTFSPTAGSTYNTDGKFGNTEIGGVTRTTNSSFVNTVVTGTGQAVGGAGGLAQAQASGQGEFHTEGTGPRGQVAGGSQASTGTGVISMGNGTATRTGGMLADFGASANADITNQTTKSPSGVLGNADIKNAGTSSFANGISMVSGPTGNVQAGAGMGGLSNDASAFGGAISSVAGQVSASHR